jgi:cyanophycin synthetase
MDVSRIRALRGPNLWSRRTAIQVEVMCDAEERCIEQLTGFETRLRERFSQIGPLHKELGSESVSLAHVLAACALQLQALAGCRLSFSRVVQTAQPGIYQSVVEYTEEAVGLKAFEYALTLIEAARLDAPFDVAAAIAALGELDEDIRLGPSTGCIVDAAIARGIPYRRLTEGSLVQFGWGVKQRRIQAAEVDRTSAIAESIAQDKDLTKRLLHSIGVPVPQGQPVDTVEQALQAWKTIGAPVVVKPRDGNQGRGVTVNIETEAQLQAAFKTAQAIGDEVIVERYLPGHDFRLLVVGNHLAAAARRDPPLVIGDGEHSIKALVEQVNADPRRGDGHATSLTKIRLDEIALARLALQGYTPDSIPPKGTRVVLRNNANLSTGGTATDVTDEVHPELAARAVEAAQMVGLDICGVDVVCQTISRPLEEQGGGIVEVNAAPGLRMHLSPSFGKPRQLGEAIIGTMFPDGEDGRIPVVAVTGVNGKTTTVRLIARLLQTSGKQVGFTDTNGVYVGDQTLDTGDCSGPKSARNLLMHPDVEAAVLETARGGMLREGLGFDRCAVAVVTNVGAGDHLGMNHIETVEQLAEVKRIIVQNVAPDGMAVLNAADPLVAKMAEHCPGSVTFFAHDGALPRLATHRAQGGRVVYVEHGAIVCAQGRSEHRIAMSQIALTANGSLRFQVENAMAAIGAAWALALPWPVIEQGLAEFVSDSDSVPGRFNRFEYRGATLIADYGHNRDAIAALVAAVQTMPARRRLAVISGAGDRRDEDIVCQTELLGEAFDEVVLYQDAAQRGRPDGEVLGLLRKGLACASRTRRVDEIRGEFMAIDVALSRLGRDDVCLVLIDQVDEALAHIARRIQEG